MNIDSNQIIDLVKQYYRYYQSLDHMIDVESICFDIFSKKKD
jgi:hypothetical protein